MLGLITLPAACWAFGRLGRFRYPMPELFAFAGLAFALDESFSIYGGNLKSTMAGEFSFSIALSLGILGLGLLSAGLRTGKYRVWTAVVLAAACCSHGIVLIFVAFSAVIICLLWIDRTRLVYSVTVGITTVLLLTWWVGPFLLDHAFMTDMKYGARPQGAEDSFWDMFFPLTAPLDILITSLAVIGFVGLRDAAPPDRLGARRDRPRLRRRRLPHPGQPAGDRPAVEPATAAVRLPRPLPPDDGRRGRGAHRRVERRSTTAGRRCRPASDRRPRSPGSPRSSCS